MNESSQYEASLNQPKTTGKLKELLDGLAKEGMDLTKPYDVDIILIKNPPKP